MQRHVHYVHPKSTYKDLLNILNDIDFSFVPLVASQGGWGAMNTCVISRPGGVDCLMGPTKVFQVVQCCYLDAYIIGGV
jgi:hypothetical protein